MEKTSSNDFVEKNLYSDISKYSSPIVLKNSIEMAGREEMRTEVTVSTLIIRQASMMRQVIMLKISRAGSNNPVHWVVGLLTWASLATLTSSSSPAFVAKLIH